jgi:hypothetical protein
MKTNEAPNPGIYKDVPFAEYLSWPAVSNSGIKLALRSLAHFKARPEIESTSAMRLGSFLHCGVLEPLAIVERYAVMPRYENDAENVTRGGEKSSSTGTVYFKEKAAEFRAANVGKEIVSEEDYKALVGVHRSLMQSERAREYLTEWGHAEVSILWKDPETELLCKARIDFLNSGINDLKSCADAARFANAMADNGYHRQAAHYQNGYRVLTGEAKPFRLIAVESKPPHGVRAAPVNIDALETGWSEVRRALLSIAEAYRDDNWPSYSDPSSWCLPSWYGGGDAIELTMNGQTISI